MNAAASGFRHLVFQQSHVLFDTLYICLKLLHLGTLSIHSTAVPSNQTLPEKKRGEMTVLVTLNKVTTLAGYRDNLKGYFTQK